MTNAYNRFGPIVVNYWSDWLGAFRINANKINENQLIKWIAEMEDMVGDEAINSIPDSWIPDEDEDDEEWEDIPDLDHDED